jgi:predicted ferric reductase
MYLALRLYKIIQFIYNPVYFFYFVSWLIIAIAIVFTIIFTQILILYVNNRMKIKIKITCIKYSIYINSI